MLGPETQQKILLTGGPNTGSSLRYWQNLLEKVTAKKIDLNRIISLEMGGVPIFPKEVLL